MAMVVLVALAVGTFGGSEPSDDQRAQALERSIRCPQCASQSVAQSETPSAKGVKVVIADRIATGNSDEEIRDYVASRYGRVVLLDPSGKGFGALVWGLPVAAAVVAVGALVLRFRDWRPGEVAVTDADRDLVRRTMERTDHGDGASADGSRAADPEADDRVDSDDGAEPDTRSGPDRRNEPAEDDDDARPARMGS